MRAADFRHSPAILQQIADYSELTPSICIADNMSRYVSKTHVDYNVI